MLASIRFVFTTLGTLAPVIAGILPGARLETTSGLRHRRIHFVPEVVRSVVEFIEEASVRRQSLHAARDGA